MKGIEKAFLQLALVDFVLILWQMPIANISLILLPAL
jgi:hypothetical protein